MSSDPKSSKSGDRRRFLASWVGASLLLLPLSAGCNVLDALPLATATATVSEEFTTGSSPKIVVETFNGAIDVSDGRDDEVVVEVTKRASGLDHETAEANLDSIEVTMVQKENSIHIVAKSVGHFQGNSGAAVVIAAPKAARLQLRSRNGHIVCEGMRGGIDATTSNGRCEFVDSQGEIDVVTGNGAIEIEATDARVDAHTSNGRIAFRGSLSADMEHRFETSNGQIELALPAESRFHFEGSTSNGRIHCEFPITSEGRESRRRLIGAVGENPTTSIIASTSNASINIRKAGPTKE
jgi:DUF4097 and DUF4098 domain-containing protein YvlB